MVDTERYTNKQIGNFLEKMFADITYDKIAKGQFVVYWQDNEGEVEDIPLGGAESKKQAKELVRMARLAYQIGEMRGWSEAMDSLFDAAEEHFGPIDADDEPEIPDVEFFEGGTQRHPTLLERYRAAGGKKNRGK